MTAVTFAEDGPGSVPGAATPAAPADPGAPKPKVMLPGACALCACTSARRWYRLDEPMPSADPTDDDGADDDATYVAGKEPAGSAVCRSCWAGARSGPARVPAPRSTRRASAVLPRAERAAVARVDRRGGAHPSGRAIHAVEVRPGHEHPRAATGWRRRAERRGGGPGAPAEERRVGANRVRPKLTTPDAHQMPGIAIPSRGCPRPHRRRRTRAARCSCVGR